MGNNAELNFMDLLHRIDNLENRLSRAEGHYHSYHELFTNDGWIPDPLTWTYASATTFTLPGDATAILTKGTKIKFTQSATVKYFNVVSSSYGAPNTTVTVTGGDDYTVANAAITDNYFSYGNNPQGFPSLFNFAPTETGGFLTLGNGTLTSRFMVIGKLCLWNFALTWGTTTSAIAGTWAFSIPITAATTTAITYGSGVARDLSTTTDYCIMPSIASAASTITAFLHAWAPETNRTITTAIPFTWASTDVLKFSTIYEI